jgi:hypothetical protein
MGLAVLTVYIGAHKGLTSRSKQQLQLREVRGGSFIVKQMPSSLASDAMQL